MQPTRAAPCDRWGEDPPFIRVILGRVSSKWTVLVIATLASGPLRYSELLDRIPGISQRMLTVTVKELQYDGVLTRAAYPEVPPRVEYELTPLGASLLSIVVDRRDRRCGCPRPRRWKRSARDYRPSLLTSAKRDETSSPSIRPFIATNPDLRERELLKRAAHTAVMAKALGQRGVKEPTAGLAAEVGALALSAAYLCWLEPANRHTLAKLAEQTLRELSPATEALR
jgi:DNA-binding HxlR family transcriptional regulator